MIFIEIEGFFPDPNPDNTLQYEKAVPQTLETSVLNVMGWSTLHDVPMGEHLLSPDQASTIIELVGEPFRVELDYYMGLCTTN
ncbi:SLH domain-containing protein [Pseudomonas sp. IT-P12]|uniref:pyocin S6 family toxin immunity protein n=1 Tax=Pseudomonas sp. IT-P12 TaxID=3026450 RepID=UPI0039E19882